MKVPDWQRVKCPPPLDQRMHIWRAHAESFGCSPRAPGSRNRELVARFLERLLVGYLGRMPELGKERRGRPFVPGKPLDFNLSHSGNWIVGAFVRHGRVGVDIEHMRTDRDLPGIAKRFFAPEEAQAVGTDPLGRFYRYWTAKEAALKMTGQGLSGGLDSTRPEWDGPAVGTVKFAGGAACPVRWFEPARGFAGAVVYDGAEFPEWEFYELS